MEDVLGGHGSAEDFARFLANWEVVLSRRVDSAVVAFSAVEGVRGLILAGGNGRGAPWPLSDIDLLPIYDDGYAESARADIERRRVALLEPWIEEGWWTGLDIGKLAFGQAEVARVLGSAELEPATVLGEDRWYHALDKGYGGRAVFDLDGTAGALATWFTRHRFDSGVVAYRLTRERREVEAAQRELATCVARRDLAGGTAQVRSAVKWLQTWLLERWGERDSSLGRVGTRFAMLACSRGHGDLVEELDALSDLDEASVALRLAAAPSWVHERHDRSWRSRRHVGEDVTRLKDARDTLRVCTPMPCGRFPSRHTPSGWQSRPRVHQSRQR